MNKKIRMATLIFVMYAGIITMAYAGLTILATISTSGILTHPEILVSPSSIDWGNCTLDNSVSRTLQIVNTGNVTVQNMTMHYFFPMGFDGSVLWDAEGDSLGIGESIVSNVSLTLTSGIEGAFDFDIVIVEG